MCYSSFMSEKPPIDKYSKAAYEAGLERLSQKEAQIKSHPLQEELALHKELRKDSPSPYPFVEDEERARVTLEEETAGFRREIEFIKQDLWRQLGNAHAEAEKMNDATKSVELARMILSQIIKIEDSTHHKMEDSGNLSRRAQYFGRAVLDETEATKHNIISKKPIPAPDTIQKSLKVIQELYRQFADIAGNVLVQDRYGHATGDATA